MKANELMIGDLVSLTKTEDIAPCVVTALHPEDLFVLQPGWSAGEVVSYDTIYPIPLTPEILGKNGLDKVPELSMVLNRDTMPMYHSPMLHYVHELQNALRLCGLNDLADNFKV